tara:strand:+ start:757 stop:1632 length:876 start_codon:yes stop_codon:yes gene_type:complete
MILTFQECQLFLELLPLGEQRLICISLLNDTLFKLLILCKNTTRMKIIISPAKKLNNQVDIINDFSSIEFAQEAEFLVKEVQKLSKIDIKNLMGLSDKLTELNYQRFQRWSLQSDHMIPAIYMFKGDVYKGLRAEIFNQDQISFAQTNLRILSGLYGLLKPLDLILPYRLEMGTKIKTKYGNNLYDFWGSKLNKSLTSIIKDKEVLINLASNEYSKALKMESFKVPIITPIFKDFKNGKLKVISFYAKRARGEMANFIISNKIENISDLKLFNFEGYQFSDENNGEILFTR